MREKNNSSKKRLWMLGLSEISESIYEGRKGVDLGGIKGLESLCRIFNRVHAAYQPGEVGSPNTSSKSTD